MSDGTTHVLKIMPRYGASVLAGDKRFELRYDDRDFKVGDTISFIPPNGRELLAHEDMYMRLTRARYVVTFVLTHDDMPGALGQGYVVLSISEQARE